MCVCRKRDGKLDYTLLAASAPKIGHDAPGVDDFATAFSSHIYLILMAFSGEICYNDFQVCFF
jgi:hypothetical protein